MKIGSIDRRHLVGFAVLVLGAVLRFHGLEWGLPQVYEDAVPLKRAWMMWGWGELVPFDLNPHFFNYPTLYFYIQLLGQAVLFVVLTVFGTIRSAIDFQLLYVIDKTPFYLMGRGITAFFGIATIPLVYLMGMRLGGPLVAVTSALLLAVNTEHIANSKLVSVDVPLTFFVTLALLRSLELAREGRGRDYVLSGLYLGLATSIKYTAALLAVPMAVAHWVGSRTGAREGRRWGLLLGALALGAIAFFATSPFVILDYQQFWADLSYERAHMEAGHFGVTGSSTWFYYLRTSGGSVLGWPVLLLGFAGMGVLAGRRRLEWALILVSFTVPYLLMINLWNMQASRYLLPVLPPFLLFAGVMVKEILERLKIRENRPRFWAAAAVSFLVLAAIPLGAYPRHLNKTKPDTRTEVRKLIETQVPSGGFIVTEFLGPELFGPTEYWPLPQALKERLRVRRVPFFGFVKIPMFQARPELSAIFYDLSLYREVDLIVISGGVKSRYMNEPERFPTQIAFYDELDRDFRKVWELRPGEMTGPEITVYQNPRYEEPFAYRKTPPESPELRPSEFTGKESSFFYSMGLSYETFGYPQGGLDCYLRGLSYPVMSRDLPLNLIFGAVRCYLATGRAADAYALMDQVEPGLPPRDQGELKALRESLLQDYPRPAP